LFPRQGRSLDTGGLAELQVLGRGRAVLAVLLKLEETADDGGSTNASAKGQSANGSLLLYRKSRDNEILSSHRITVRVADTKPDCRFSFREGVFAGLVELSQSILGSRSAPGIGASSVDNVRQPATHASRSVGMAAPPGRVGAAHAGRGIAAVSVVDGLPSGRGRGGRAGEGAGGGVPLAVALLVVIPAIGTGGGTVHAELGGGAGRRRRGIGRRKPAAHVV